MTTGSKDRAFALSLPCIGKFPLQPPVLEVEGKLIDLIMNSSDQLMFQGFINLEIGQCCWAMWLIKEVQLIEPLKSWTAEASPANQPAAATRRRMRS